jgi:hypothetical protein
MRISEDALAEFIEIYKEEFGEEIDRGEAAEMADGLVTLYRLLMRRLPDEGAMQDANNHPRIGFQT